MAQKTSKYQRGAWTSQSGFILAALGSAVGLGNIWRFPGVAYQNGGGAFLLPYLIALLTAGVVILLLDYAIGHRFRGSAPLALRRAAGRPGETLGWFQVMINVIIAIYYTAVIAWTSMFFIFSFKQNWESGASTQEFFLFDYLQLDTENQLTFDLVPAVVIPMVVFWVLVLAVLALGVAKGVQKANSITIPLLFVSFLALVIGALLQPGAVDGLNAFFTPDFSQLGKPQIWVAAYGQIFFSLSVAFGIMITYSSYQKRRANMASSGLVVAFGNSSFELLAGVGVFAALGYLAHTQGVAVGDLEGLTGPMLAFATFPAIVSALPLSWLFGTLFFGSLLLAGFTSLLSILEVVLAGFIDKFGLSRGAATWGVGLPMAVISVLLIGTTTGLITLDTLDFFSNQMGIVASAIVTVVLVIWVNRRGGELAGHLSAISTFKVGKIWQVFVGILAPLVIGYMLVQVIISTVSDGYEGYEGWYLGVFGWGTLALMLIASIVLTLLPWNTPVRGFKAWPPIPGAKPADEIANAAAFDPSAGKES
ncbi:sodium-dependent transporter [Canibacter zhoujuaniae]|uniref:sodium-dependent transporter n=1 Tax=Canibacter zhoujuaniae TaxID=2708343 RepID=UPI001422E3E0|nr:sodium-dependent transporter [Canibacter zhoujuaniae]